MARLKIARRGAGRPRTRPGQMLGDKAYSSTAIRAHLRRRKIKATIPEPADQVKNRLRRGSRGGRPPAFDPVAYKQRRDEVVRADHPGGLFHVRGGRVRAAEPDVVRDRPLEQE